MMRSADKTYVLADSTKNWTRLSGDLCQSFRNLPDDHRTAECQRSSWRRSERGVGGQITSLVQVSQNREPLAEAI